MSKVEWKSPRGDFGRQVGKTKLQDAQMWKWLIDTKVASLESVVGVSLDQIGDEYGIERYPCREIFLGWPQECVLQPMIEEQQDDWANELVLEA